MSKNHPKKQDNLQKNKKQQNEIIKKNKDIASAPKTKERASPGELHKVQ